MQLKIISAGAGSGKTYRLTGEMVQLLRQGVRAQGIIATTFTQKAAAELQERVRVRLLEEGLHAQAEELTNALIGTVHGLGVKLLRRFAYEAGVSPEVSIIAEEDQQLLFNQSLAMVLTERRVEAMQVLCERLGVQGEWREEVRRLTEVARINNFSAAVLRESCKQSVQSLEAFMEPAGSMTLPEVYRTLEELMDTTIVQLESNGDSTKLTVAVVEKLKSMQQEIRRRGSLHWPQWAELYKLAPGAKSREAVHELQAFAATHVRFPAFRQDIRDFVNEIFELSIAAIQEYQAYKQKRGLIDYTDMEALVNQLLDDPTVQEVLAEELELLLVDEFQDTSPLQLALFLKLSRLAAHSIWVGDPKQSIYGFRGADPMLMQEIIRYAGGIRPEDIQRTSYRSREDLVHTVNAVFTRAFPDIPVAQVALEPHRTSAKEPVAMEPALRMWKIEYSASEEDGKRLPGKPWLEQCVGQLTADFLASRTVVSPKGGVPRPVQPGDIAILCRSNAQCQAMAEALHHAGLRVSMARTGLLETVEAALLLACLKYLLHKKDTLSLAELLVLAEGLQPDELIENRLAFLEQYEAGTAAGSWAAHLPLVAQLNKLRYRVGEMSSSETVDLILGELDLRRIIASWGNTAQRLGNVERIRSLALQYEDSCNRLQSAASLGGFLLWLNSVRAAERDYQSAGEDMQAVQVLTYHKSKGLEWPVVVCHDMGNSLRADVWGLDLVSANQEIDLNDLLGGRTVQYWVNPYGTQYAKTPLHEAILASDLYARKRRRALEEENRLLYVGLTRARDYLIFPQGPKEGFKWLNRAWHEGKEDVPVLDAAEAETPFEWNGRFILAHTLVQSFGKAIPAVAPEEVPVRYIQSPAGSQDYPPLYIDFNKDKAPGYPQVGMLNRFSFGQRIQADQQGVQLLRQFLMAVRPEYDAVVLAKIAEGLVVTADAGGLSTDDLVQAGIRWQQWLRQTVGSGMVYPLYPLRGWLHNRLCEVRVDWWVETDSGPIAIAMDLFAGEESQLKARALQSGNWSTWVRWVDSRSSRRAVRTMVCFPAFQEVLEIGG